MGIDDTSTCHKEIVNADIIGEVIGGIRSTTVNSDLKLIKRLRRHSIFWEEDDVVHGVLESRYLRLGPTLMSKEITKHETMLDDLKKKEEERLKHQRKKTVHRHYEASRGDSDDSAERRARTKGSSKQSSKGEGRALSKQSQKEQRAQREVRENSDKRKRTSTAGDSEDEEEVEEVRRHPKKKRVVHVVEEEDEEDMEYMEDESEREMERKKKGKGRARDERGSDSIDEDSYVAPQSRASGSKLRY